jgi:hypothetical protein
MIPEAVRQAMDRAVTLAELLDVLERPISTERDEVVSLLRWFTRRYPSPEARLAYVKRAYARWTRAQVASP